ncbi:MAG: hypothetical protein AAF772_14265 [Acidobacteriota bacterium]
MSTAQLVLFMLGTALLAGLAAAAFSLLAVRWLIERQIRPEFEKLLDETADELTSRIEQGVRKGVRDAVTELPSAEVLGSTARTAARTGAGLVGGGLDILLGGRRGGKPQGGGGD